MEHKENVHRESIVDTLKDNYMPYAMSVIVSRAIPEIDGFKPSHRKLLFTMYKMGLLTGRRSKSSNIVGQTMKYNPHGDGPIYETMVRLAESNESQLHGYIDSKGNFGKVYSREMKYAAARYTEAKLAGICKELFHNIDKDVVDFVDNFDGELKEPKLLPTTFPNILLKSNKGIAVGMASSIPSFNLEEICNYTIAHIDRPGTPVTKHIQAPDFHTGATILLDHKEMEDILRTGRGSFRMRAKYRYLRKENLIEIYEIPYPTTIEAIIEKTIDQIKKGRIKEINDIRDETDLKGLCITIDLKRGVDPDLLMDKLYKMTTLEDSFACNFNILLDGHPKVMGIAEIIKEWLLFRRGSVIRLARYEQTEKSNRLHLLEGLELILLDIDRAIAIIRQTEKEKDVVPRLMEAFQLTDVQAEYVADIKLRNLNKEYLLKRIGEIEQLKKDIAVLLHLQADEKAQNNYIKKELRAVIKSHKKQRRTDLVSIDEVSVYVPEEDSVGNYHVNVFVTKEGYIKKITDGSLRGNDLQKLKENDEILYEISMNNDEILYVLSSKQTMYQLKIDEVPDTKASQLGDYLPNLLGGEEDEELELALYTKDHAGHIVFVYRNGKIAKIPLAAYQTKSFRSRIKKAYSEVSPLVQAFYMPQSADVVLNSSKDRSARIPIDLVSEKVTKSSQGVQAVRLHKEETVESCMVIPIDREHKPLPRASKIPSVMHKVEQNHSFFEEMK